MTVIDVARIPLKTIDLSPGSHLLLSDVTWDQYEALLEDLGEDRRVPRINYCDGILELMSPLPAHERPHRIMAYVVTNILDAQDRPWEDFGSTTFRKPKRAGLESDTCFYTQNAARVRSLMRMDMAIEADVTSKMTLDAYRVLQIPEVWIYDNGRLKIMLLRQGDYQEATRSLIFPELDLCELMPRLVNQAFQEGTSAMLRGLRQRLQAGEPL
jgi:Uma2 family endonuclease